MKKLIGAAIVVAVLGAGFLAYRVGWLGRLTPGAGPPGEAGPAGTAAGVGAGVGAGGGIGGGAKVGGGTATTSGSGADIAAAGSGAAAGEPTLIPFETLAPGGNIARLDLGAVIESTTSDYGRDWSALFVLGENARTAWSSANNTDPQELVLSFFNRQPALISAVAVNPGRKGYEERFPKDVEIWVSTTSPTEGFTKLTSTRPGGPRSMLPIVGGNAITLGNLGKVYGRAGRTAEARQLLEELTARRRLTCVPASAFVFVHGGLGARDKALEWMATGIEERDPILMTSLWMSPSYDPLRSHPAFQALLRKMNPEP